MELLCCAVFLICLNFSFLCLNISIVLIYTDVFVSAPPRLLEVFRLLTF